VRSLRSETEFDSASALRAKAREFACLAAEARDPVAVLELRSLAREYERVAETLEHGHGGAPAMRAANSAPPRD
jgi:hypothetical protein